MQNIENNFQSNNDIIILASKQISKKGKQQGKKKEEHREIHPVDSFPVNFAAEDFTSLIS